MNFIDLISPKWWYDNLIVLKNLFNWLIKNPKYLAVVLIVLTSSSAIFFVLFLSNSQELDDYKEKASGLESKVDGLEKKNLVLKSGANELDIKATFHIPKSGNWRVNETYTFELLLDSSEEIDVFNIVYFKPLEKGLSPPIATNYSDCSFIDKKKNTLSGLINTTNADKGRFNICVSITDKRDPKRKFDYCREAQSSIED